jgi:hypothetical protein
MGYVMTLCRRSFLLIPLIVAVLATAAPAQLTTVETDAATYDPGQTVRITIHNPSDQTATLNSVPGYAILHEETGNCMYGCLGLPDLTILEAGENIVHNWDTSIHPDPVGTYTVFVHEVGTGAPPDPAPPSITYTLGNPTANKRKAWSGIKSFYR